jgi:hypothetical protein
MFVKDEDKNDESYRDIYGNKVLPDKDFKSFQFKTADNPHIDRQEIEDAKRLLSPAFFRQEWEASFENYTGIIYKEFETRHIINIATIEQATGKRFIKDWWKIFVGIDTGRHTAVTFMAIDDKGKKYVFDEIYDYDGMVKDIATQIKHKLQDIGRKNAVYIIDSASQVKREYEQHGIPCIDSEKDVENQIEQVRNSFSNDTLFIDGEQAPMHVVEHKGYIWNEKSKKIEPVKENDHTCNSVQYILSTYMAGKAIDKYKVKTFNESFYKAVITRSDETKVTQMS